MDERGQEAALALGVVALTALVALVLAPSQPDAAFVGYRYARHLAAGTGFVFNPGTTQHLAVAPLFVMLLADLAQLIPDIPALGVALSALFVGAGGLLLLRADHDERAVVERAVSAFAYVAFPLWWLDAGTEASLVGFLALAAVTAQARQKTLPAAILAGLALLFRPITILLGLIFLADIALDQRRIPWREALALALLTLLGAVIALWAFGLPFPSRLVLGGASPGGALVMGSAISRALAGLGQVGGALLRQSWLWAGALALALAGLARIRERWWLLLLLIWALLHGVALDVLGVSPARGDYVPFVVVFAALAGLGGTLAWEKLSERVDRSVLWSGAALLLAGSFIPSLWAIRQAPARDDAYHVAHGLAMLPAAPRHFPQEAGEWLSDDAPPEAIIAAQHVGRLGYYAERTVIDPEGSLVPAGRRLARSGDAFYYLSELAPDYVVLSRTGQSARGGYQPLEDAWFAQNYAGVQRFGDASTLGGPLVIYERIAEAAAIAEADLPTAVEVDVRYRGGLRLQGFETDLTLDPLPTDRVVLLRLQWLPTRPLPGERTLVVRLESREGVSAGQDSQVALTGQWASGTPLTTYHSFETASALVPGLYELKVGVGPTPEDLEWQAIAQAKVPLGEEPFGGGLTGGGGRWPELALLRGFRLNRTEDGLEVALLWEALADLDEDYTVRLELRDSGGEVVESAEGPPHDDTYPTSIWSEGEQVPDAHTMALDDVPPGEYAVHVSWLDPTGTPRPTEGGDTSLQIAPFFVE